MRTAIWLLVLMMSALQPVRAAALVGCGCTTGQSCLVLLGLIGLGCRTCPDGTGSSGGSAETCSRCPTVSQWAKEFADLVGPILCEWIRLPDMSRRANFFGRKDMRELQSGLFLLGKHLHEMPSGEFRDLVHALISCVGLLLRFWSQCLYSLSDRHLRPGWHSAMFRVCRRVGFQHEYKAMSGLSNCESSCSSYPVGT